MFDQLLHGTATRPLSASDQIQLASEYRRTADPALERRLVETNLRLVVKLAHQMDRSHGRCLEDLVQEGTLGLIEGIRRFNPAKGTRLSTYAAFWIRAYIMKYLMDNVRVVRVVRSRSQRLAFFKGVVGGAEISFDTAVDPDGAPIGELLADSAPGPESSLETAQLLRGVKRCAARLLRRLGTRDLTILKERVLAPEPAPLRIIATRVSLSAERVRQIERALRNQIRSAVDGGQLEIAA
jgi:RNA polymerase sigma-32 factor